jgi:hypothetical protein
MHRPDPICAQRLAMITAAVFASAGAAAGDAMPFLTAAYFAKSCPTGWTELPQAKGRFIVPSPQGAGTGGFVGTALDGSTSAPQHEHQKAEASITLVARNFVLIGGCCNERLGRSGAYTMQGSASKAPASLPNIQYVACMKTDTSVSGSVPADVMAFSMAGAYCADGWREESAAKGRYIVGLPDNGTAYASFGGAPLRSGELRTHTHEVSSSLQFPESQIAGASGCCAENYASSGSADFSGATVPDPDADHPDDSAASAPYFTATLCRKY